MGLLNILILIYGLLITSKAQDDSLIVSTTYGKIKGKIVKTDLGTEVNTWYGIPYAEPPLGDLRFKRPIPPQNWDGIRNTTEQIYACSQPKFDVSILGADHMMNSDEAKKYRVISPSREDCLYLNVISPGTKPKNLEVIIWLYGLSFFGGSTTMGIFSYEILSSLQNIIIVAPQYRVGAFGFLYTGDENAPGNAGLYDQLLALRWVKDNIENFGGDPSKITLMGSDAGAASVGFHMFSPLSEKLFLRGILLSGSPVAPGVIQDKSVSIRKLNAFANYFNCSNDENDYSNLVSCLQKVDSEDLVKKDFETYTTNFLPVVDGEFILEDPSVTINKPWEKPIHDILMGTVSDEGTFILLFLMPQLLSLNTELKLEKEEFIKGVEIIGSIFKRSGSLNKAIIQEYFNYDDPNNSFLNVKALDSIYSDFLFHCPSNEFINFVSENNGNVFQYYFNSFLPMSPKLEWIGANHLVDMGYLFGNNLKKLSYQIPNQIKDASMRMMSYFGNFAKTG